MAAYGIGAAAGGFADGYLKGRMAREQINSNKMEKTLNEQRLKDAERETKKGERLDASREALTAGLDSLEKEYNQGAGGFLTFMPPRMGMQGPETFDLETAHAEQPAKSPWGGGAAYKDPTGANEEYDGRLSKLYKSYYAATDEPDKAFLVDNTISTMRENRTDRLIKKASSALLVGAPDGPNLLDQVAGVAGLGRVNPKSGTFDPKTRTWTGIEMTQTDGSTVVRNFTPDDIMGLANFSDPAKHFELLNEKAYRDETLKNQKLGLANDSRQLDNDGRRIEVAEASSKFEAEDRRKGREMERDRGNVDLLHKIISNSFKPPIKPDAGVYKLAQALDEPAQARITAYDASVVEYEDRTEITNRLVDGSQNLMTLNSGLKPQDAAYIMQNNARFRPQRGPGGRLYIEYKGQKLWAE
ncbi:hypothetical protein UFOVP1304_22 [uncultured Caudovirales phage]|uniref:Uncharacterized protein n=1 Tax=uncultured Caudovirales phage TaxID=2100421 RepID=A0A6J5RU87_9CAUD|nr:hypothetical protein UFOVP1304_22 [uncultured Caudovirales phage]